MKTSVLFFSAAENKNELRDVKNLAAFAQILDFSKEEAKTALRKTPRKLFEKKKLEGFEILK